MKNHERYVKAIRLPVLWFVLLAAILVFFPFEWLSKIWPAYALVFDQVFATLPAHEIGHATVFLLAGLLVLFSISRLRRYPLLYAALMVVGLLGEELLQALSLHRWQLSSLIDGHAFVFDTLGLALAYLCVWIVWKFRKVVRVSRGRQASSLHWGR